MCWLNEHALAVVSEQGPRSHVRLYDASGWPQLLMSSLPSHFAAPFLCSCHIFVSAAGLQLLFVVVLMPYHWDCLHVWRC